MLYHTQIFINRNFVETSNKPLSEIAENMKKTRKITYFKDKDGVERTIKGNNLMSKRDISKILELYEPPHSLKPTKIYHRRCFRYRYAKIKLLISQYEKIKELRRGNLPENYLNLLFYAMNKKHLEKDETNKFIIGYM